MIWRHFHVYLNLLTENNSNSALRSDKSKWHQTANKTDTTIVDQQCAMTFTSSLNLVSCSNYIHFAIKVRTWQKHDKLQIDSANQNKTKKTVHWRNRVAIWCSVLFFFYFVVARFFVIFTYNSVNKTSSSLLTLYLIGRHFSKAFPHTH